MSSLDSFIYLYEDDSRVDKDEDERGSHTEGCKIDEAKPPREQKIPESNHLNYASDDEIEFSINEKEEPIGDDSEPMRLQLLPNVYQSNDKRVLEACLIISFCAFPLGWDVGTMGFMLKHPSFTSSFDVSSPTTMGIVISSFNIGCLIGCLTLGQLKINMKHTIRLCLASYVVGAGFEILSSYGFLPISGFLCGRLLGGVCCGALCVLSPIYTNEMIIDEEKREVYLSFFQTQVCFWILCGNVSNLFYDHLSMSHIFVEYCKLAFTLMFSIAIFRLPDSVGCYLRKGNATKLLNVYKKIYRNADEELVREKMSVFEMTSPQKTVFKDCLEIFKRPKIKNTLLCCSVMAFQQLTGINYFFYYGNIVFDSKNAVTYLSIVNLVGALLSGKIIKWFQLKLILVVGSFSMAILMCAYSVLGHVKAKMPQVIGPILITLSCSFVLAFAVSWGPCSGILNSIVSENHNFILGLSVSINWIVNFMISMVTPMMISQLGFSYGFVFCLNLAIMGLFVIFTL